MIITGASELENAIASLLSGGDFAALADATIKCGEKVKSKAIQDLSELVFEMNGLPESLEFARILTALNAATWDTPRIKATPAKKKIIS